MSDDPGKGNHGQNLPTWVSCRVNTAGSEAPASQLGLEGESRNVKKKQSPRLSVESRAL